MSSIRSFLKVLPVVGVLAVATPVAASAQAPQVAPQVTVGNLISALNNISVQIQRLNALNDLTVQRIRIVDVDNVLNDANIQAFNNALNRNNVEIVKLRDVLNNNEIVKQALNDNNVAVTDVVAINVLSGGDLVIFQR